MMQGGQRCHKTPAKNRSTHAALPWTHTYMRFDFSSLSLLFFLLLYRLLGFVVFFFLGGGLDGGCFSLFDTPLLFWCFIRGGFLSIHPSFTLFALALLFCVLLLYFARSDARLWRTSGGDGGLGIYWGRYWCILKWRLEGFGWELFSIPVRMY